MDVKILVLWFFFRITKNSVDSWMSWMYIPAEYGAPNFWMVKNSYNGNVGFQQGALVAVLPKSGGTAG